MAATRVLVVEDDTPVRTLVRDVLEADGFAVLEAADGAEGLRLLAEQPPELVITDWQMPRLHGRHVVAASRELARGVPVIVLSGDSGRARDEFDPKDTQLHVVRKPFDPDRLRSLARRLTRARRE